MKRCDLKSSVAYASQQIRDRREGSHTWQILGLETIAAPLVHFFAMVSLLSADRKTGMILSPPANLLVAELFHHARELGVPLEVNQVLTSKRRTTLDLGNIPGVVTMQYQETLNCRALRSREMTVFFTLRYPGNERALSG